MSVTDFDAGSIRSATMAVARTVIGSVVLNFVIFGIVTVSGPVNGWRSVRARMPPAAVILRNDHEHDPPTRLRRTL